MFSYDRGLFRSFGISPDMKTLLLSLLICCALGLPAQVDPALAEALQAALNSSVSTDGNIGVSAQLMLADGNTWSGQAGTGRGGQAISDSSLFHGASTTKLNVAILTLLLMEEGLLALDAPWTSYVNLNVDFDPEISLRQLLGHTSGIADYLETASSGSDITSDFSYFYTPQEILEDIVPGTPLFTAGDSFTYSNSNYVLLGLTIEAVTGNPLHTELRSRIWEPLGMEHTYLGAYESYTEPQAGVHWNFGFGLQDYSDVPSTSMLSYAYGAGNIVSCPSDLALLLHALMSGQLLAPASMDEMLSYDPSSYASWTAGYGLGIHHASSDPDDTLLGHDGYYSNLTDMFYSENCGFTLVTMSNTQTEWFGVFDLLHAIVQDYCSTTDLPEESSYLRVDVYPNPSTDLLQISSNARIEAVEILDSSGRMVYKASGDLRRVLLDTIGNGIFTVMIQTDLGMVKKSIQTL